MAPRTRRSVRQIGYEERSGFREMCSPADIGHTAFVPYEADYVFFTNPTATTAVSERN